MMGRGVVTVLLFAVLATAFLPSLRAEERGQPATLDATFSANVPVNSGNPTYLHQVEPTMVINSEGRIFVGWKEAFTHDGGGQRVSFAHSSDGGETWSPNVFMPLNRTNRQSDPWLSITSDRVFFTRLEFNSALTVSGMTVSATTDGVVWGPSYYYHDSPNFADKETAAHDAAESIYWAWNTDYPTGVQDIVVARSDDGGRSWTSESSVPDPGDGVIGAFVKVHTDGTVLLTWWSYLTNDIWFDRSSDRGATWGTDIRVNDIAGSAGDGNPSDWTIPLPAMDVAADGTVFVVWTDHRRGNHDVMFSRSTDRGATWSPTIRLNDDVGAANQWMPDLAVDPSGGIHVAWIDQRNGQNDVYYASSTDGGLTWGPNARVTDAGTPASFWRPGDYLALESDISGGIHVVWTDGRRGDLDIFYAKLVKTATMTLTSDPPGLLVELDDVPRMAPYSFECLIGRSYEIAAPSPQGGVGTRYTFESWSDAGLPRHQVLCSGPATHIATFLVEHEVTIDTSPPNLVIHVAGIARVAPHTSWWPQASSAIVEAPSPQGSSSTRYVFDAWSDYGDQAHSIMITEPQTLLARFRAEHFLLVQSLLGTVSCDSLDCWYRQDTVATFSVSPLTVEASRDTRFEFTGWEGDSNATSGTATITMDRPHVVSAVWSTQYLLTVTSPLGATTGAGWYVADAEATFSVYPSTIVGSPGTRHVFTAWSGNSTAASETARIAMRGPRAVTATWATEHELKVMTERGTPTGMGWYVEGAMASFSVSPLVVDGPPGTRYVFVRWTGDVEASSGSASLAMNGPRVVTAVWRTEYELTVVSSYGTPTGAGWHPEGASVTVRIEIEVKVGGRTYRFLGWTGDEVRVGPTIDVAMTGPKRIEASWEEVISSRDPGPRVSSWLVVWLVALAVILFLAILFVWRRRRREEEPPAPPPT